MEVTDVTDKPSSKDGTRFPTWFEIEKQDEKYTKLFGDQERAVYTCMVRKSKKLVGHYLATATAKKWKLKKIDLAKTDLVALFNPGASNP